LFKAFLLTLGGDFFFPLKIEFLGDAFLARAVYGTAFAYCTGSILYLSD